MLKNSRPISATVQVNFTVNAYIMTWFVPMRESSRKLFETYRLGMKVGDFTMSMYALGLSLRYALLEGENLSLISRSLKENLKKMMKYSTVCAKLAVLDLIIVDELRGAESEPFAIFQGQLTNDSDLINDAIASSNANNVECAHFRRFYSAFWRADYIQAEASSQVLLSLPSSKRPKLISIYFYFFRGLLAFRRYRENNSEEQLRIGIETICKLEFWSQYAPSNFENKLFLLNAEQYASLPNIYEAKTQYEASINSARDNGRLHEQGLAFELMGNFLSSVTSYEPSEAMKCWKNAYLCYLQWGAKEKAACLFKEHNLNVFDVDSCGNPLKHSRDVS